MLPCFFFCTVVAEEEREAKQYELNLLTDEVDRAQARLLSLEREKVGSGRRGEGGFRA